MMRWICVLATLLWIAPAVGQSIRMGEEIFERCAMCHEVGAQAENRQGPHLNGLLGRRAASLPDFPYSAALRDAGLQRRWPRSSNDRNTSSQALA
jgi:cytochrome c2